MQMSESVYSQGGVVSPGGRSTGKEQYRSHSLPLGAQLNSDWTVSPPAPAPAVDVAAAAAAAAQRHSQRVTIIIIIIRQNRFIVEQRYLFYNGTMKQNFLSTSILVVGLTFYRFITL